MALNLLFYPLLLVALLLICLMIHVWWPDDQSITPQTPFKLNKPRRKRSKECQPFTGLLYQPLCEVSAQGADTRPKAPGASPPLIICTRGRPA